MARRAFTLVEVTVVVVILGILLAIALPQLAGPRETSREKACLENVRIIDQAKQLWMMENGKAPTDDPTWHDLVPRYVKQHPACPVNGEYLLGNGQVPAVYTVHGS